MKDKELAKEPQTLGEHLKHRRLILKLSQPQAAKLMTVCASTVLHWEKDETHPPIEHFPAMFQFLGYDPFPQPRTISEHMLAYRRKCGWSIKRAAKELGIDEGTWGEWESGQIILFRKHREMMAHLLDLSVDELNREMAERWNRTHKM